MPLADYRNHQAYKDPGAKKRFDRDRQRAAQLALPTQINYQHMAPKVGPVDLPGIGMLNEGAGRANPNSYSSSQLQAFLQGIAQQESGGNYGAVGVPTKYGTALGKYQILDANMAGPGGWDAEALGRDISLHQFLNSPQLQESIARAKLTEYFKNYGAEGAAKAWYAGPGNANTNSDSPQYGGPSINDYAASVLNNMQRYIK